MAKYWVGIEIGTREIRGVALGKQGRRMAVLAAGRHEVAPTFGLAGALESSQDWLRAFLDRFPGAEIAASLPAGGVLARIVDFPPVTGPTLDELVRFEAQQLFPLPDHEAVVGYAPV